MARECFHCKQIVRPGEAHDCWTTTVAALTRDPPADLREAWERLREAVGDHGEQRIHASHNSLNAPRASTLSPRARRTSVQRVGAKASIWSFEKILGAVEVRKP